MPNNSALAMYNICRQCPHSGECDDWEQARWDNECPLNNHNEHNVKHDNDDNDHDNYYGGDCFDDGATTGSDGDGDCTD